MSSQSSLYCTSMNGGIYRASFTGGPQPLSELTLLPGTPGNFFITRHPRLPVVYTLDIKGARIHALAQDEAGNLTPINDVASEGEAPCHLAIDPQRRKLVVANYNGGVSLYSILPDGALTPATSVFLPTGTGADPKRQDKPHPHGVTLADGLASIADLGTDRIQALRIERDLLTPEPQLDAALHPGAGPRHFVIHSSGRIAACVNELDNTVTTFLRDPQSGKLTSVATRSTLPEGYTEESWTAEIEFHPKRDLLIATNRGHDTLALFAFDPHTAALEPATLIPSGGEKPQHFVFTPQGDFLLVANTGGKESGNVVLFQINPATGLPEEIQRIAVPQPMWLLL